MRRLVLLFFFNHTPTTDIYTLSLHDALPISVDEPAVADQNRGEDTGQRVGGMYRLDHASAGQPDFMSGANFGRTGHEIDRKSTRLNSSHTVISYAVFCLKKKKKK